MDGDVGVGMAVVPTLLVPHFLTLISSFPSPLSILLAMVPSFACTHRSRTLSPPLNPVPCTLHLREAAGRQCHLPAERFVVLADGQPLSAQTSVEEADYFNRAHGLAIVSV